MPGDELVSRSHFTATRAVTIVAQPPRRTRLVARLKQSYQVNPATIVTVILAEFGDCPMMRKMLLGIKRRAEICGDAQTRAQLSRKTSA